MCWVGLEALSLLSRTHSSPAMMRAWAWLEISEAQARGSSLGFNIF